MAKISTSSRSLLLPAFLFALFMLFAWVLVNNTYAYALINLDPSVKVDNSTEEVLGSTQDTVEVEYREEGKFLALVPIKFTARAIVRADGTIELKYPWYSVLTIDKKSELETRIKVAVDNALKARLVGSVQAEGKVANPVFTLVEAAEVTTQIRRILKADLGEDVDY